MNTQAKTLSSALIEEAKKNWIKEKKRGYHSFFLELKKSVFCFAFPCVSSFSRLALSL